MANDKGVAFTLDEISGAANRAVSGVEKATAVINGLHDKLILLESVSEYWQDKSFGARADEITRQSELGMVTALEEAQLWKKLDDEKLFGWRNAMVAQQNYLQKMYENSKRWIEDQTRLGRLSAEEIADAWGRVYEQFDDLNIKYEAAMNMRSTLLQDSYDYTANRRQDSDRWMQRQDLRGNSDLNTVVDDYSRRIASELELLAKIEGGVLNGVSLGSEEQKKLWLETYQYIEDLQDKQYLTAKQFLKKQIDDYAKAALEKTNIDYENAKLRNDNELKFISDKYDEIERRRRENDREAERDELVRLRNYYANAVTKEGRDKLAQINKQIYSIDSEAQSDELSIKKQQEIAAVNAQFEYDKKRFEQAKTGIDVMKKNMLELSGEITDKSVSNAVSAGIKIKNNLLGSAKDFSVEIENMFTLSENRLATYISNIGSILGSSVNSNNEAGPRIGSDSFSFVLNDYGDKNLTDNSSVLSYGDELLNLFKNTLRTQGVR